MRPTGTIHHNQQPTLSSGLDEPNQASWNSNVYGSSGTKVVDEAVGEALLERAGGVHRSSPQWTCPKPRPAHPRGRRS